MLTYIGQNLALESAEGIFKGQIEEYKDGEDLLSIDELLKLVESHIEACQG